MGFSAGTLVALAPGLYRLDLSGGFASARYATGLEKLCFEVIYILFTQLGSIYGDPDQGTKLKGYIGSLNIGGDRGRIMTVLGDEIVRAENFDELYEKTRTAISFNESDNLVLVSIIAGNNKIISDYSGVADKVDTYEKEIENNTEQIDILRKIEKSHEEQLSSIQSIGKSVEDKKEMERHLISNMESRDRQIKKNENEI